MPTANEKMESAVKAIAEARLKKFPEQKDDNESDEFKLEKTRLQTAEQNLKQAQQNLFLLRLLKGYDLCLMSNEIKPEPNKLYLRKADKHILYTVITPNGDTVYDAKLTQPLAPESFTLDILKRQKNEILAEVLKAGHIQLCSEKMHEFTDPLLREIIDFKSHLEKIYNHEASLDLSSPQSLLFVNHSQVADVKDDKPKVATRKALQS